MVNKVVPLKVKPVIELANAEKAHTCQCSFTKLNSNVASRGPEIRPAQRSVAARL